MKPNCRCTYLLFIEHFCPSLSFHYTCWDTSHLIITLFKSCFSSYNFTYNLRFIQQQQTLSQADVSIHFCLKILFKITPGLPPHCTVCMSMQYTQLKTAQFMTTKNASVQHVPFTHVCDQHECWTKILEFQHRNTIWHIPNNVRQIQVQSICWLGRMSNNLTKNLISPTVLLWFLSYLSFLSLTFSFWWIYVNLCQLFFLTLSETVEHWPIVNVNYIIQCSKSKQRKTDRFA